MTPLLVARVIPHSLISTIIFVVFCDGSVEWVILFVIVFIVSIGDELAKEFLHEGFGSGKTLLWVHCCRYNSKIGLRARRILSDVVLQVYHFVSDPLLFGQQLFKYFLHCDVALLVIIRHPIISDLGTAHRREKIGVVELILWGVALVILILRHIYACKALIAEKLHFDPIEFFRLFTSRYVENAMLVGIPVNVLISLQFFLWMIPLIGDVHHLWISARLISGHLILILLQHLDRLQSYTLIQKLVDFSLLLLPALFLIV